MNTDTDFNHDHENDYIERVEWLDDNREFKTGISDANSIIDAKNSNCLDEFRGVISNILIPKEIREECKQNGVDLWKIHYFEAGTGINENIENKRSTANVFCEGWSNLENIESSYSFTYGDDNQFSTSPLGDDYFKIDDNSGKLVLENSTGKYYFSYHCLNHSGDFAILYTVAVIGKNNCYVITEERKNLGDDLRQSGITVYSLWHFLPIMVRDGYIEKEQMLKIAKNLSRSTNQIISNEILYKSLVRISNNKS